MKIYTMKFIEKLKEILFKPKKFYSKLKKERDLLKSFKWLAVLLLLPPIFWIIINQVLLLVGVKPMITFYSPKNWIPFYVAGSFTVFITFYISYLVSMFILAGLLHLSAKFFKGKGEYEDSFNVLCYSQTPMILFGWIPILGIFFWLYSFYQLLLGISKTQKVSMLKSFGVLIFPGVVLLLISIFLGTILGISFFSALL